MRMKNELGKNADKLRCQKEHSAATFAAAPGAANLRSHDVYGGPGSKETCRAYARPNAGCLRDSARRARITHAAGLHYILKIKFGGSQK